MPQNSSPVETAADVRKQAEPVLYDLPEIARKRYLGTFWERMLAEEPSKRPELEKELRTLEAMYAAEPQALEDLRIYLGVPQSDFDQPWSRRYPRLGPISSLLALWRDLDPRGDQQLLERVEWSGPHFDPVKNRVVLPWRLPASTVHEIGHALDFNQGLFAPHGEHNWLHGLARDSYLLGKLLPPVMLWQEHAAWRRGRDAYLRGALERGYDPQEIKAMLHDIRKLKAPALGTYWGGTLGLSAGIPLAYYSLPFLERFYREQYNMSAENAAQLAINTAILGALGLSFGGAMSGFGIGKLLSRWDYPPIDREVDRALARMERRRARGQSDSRVAQLPPVRVESDRPEYASRRSEADRRSDSDQSPKQVEERAATSEPARKAATADSLRVRQLQRLRRSLRKLAVRLHLENCG